MPVSRHIELVIFDCDGVLVDSDRIALRIQAEELTTIGVPMSFEECAREFLGIGMPATLAKIEQRLGGPLPDGWEAQLERRVFAAFEQELEPVDGIVEALNRLTIPTCVASSGTHSKMRRTLGMTQLYERFAGRIFSATEVPHGKPAPDLFLHAARSCGVDPRSCAVVEDSPAGVQAARAAGMLALGYAATTRADWLMGPDTIVFRSMQDLPAILAAAVA